MQVADGNAGRVAHAQVVRAPVRMAGSLTLLDKFGLFGLGAALQFNVITATFGLPFMRLSDMVPFLLIPYFLLRPGMLSAMLSRILPIGLVVVLLAASLVLKSAPDQGDLYLTLVLLLYFIQSVQLVILFRDPSGPVWFSAGILLGMIGSLGALIAQSFAIDLTAFGLAVPVDGVDPDLLLFMQDKLGGLWSAGNMTGHVFALAGAAATYLWFRYRRSEIYVLYVLALLVSFPATNNRAGLIVPAIFLALIVRKSVSVYALLSTAAAVCALVMVFGATGYTPLPQQFQTAIEKRFVSDANTESNIDERLDSTIAAFQLIATNPFGLGSVATQNQLRAMSGLTTPHNGIVSLALQSGVLIAILFVLGAGRIVLAPERLGPFPYYTVLFLVPSLLFEELSICQVFLFFIAYVLAANVMARTEDIAAERQIPDPRGSLTPHRVPRT